MPSRYLLLILVLFKSSLIFAQGQQLRTGTFCEMYQTIRDDAKNNFSGITGSFNNDNRLFTQYRTTLHITDAVSSHIAVISNKTFFFVTLGEYDTKKAATLQLEKLMKDLKKCLSKNVVTRKTEDDGSIFLSVAETVNEQPAFLKIQNTALDTKWRIVFSLQGMK